MRSQLEYGLDALPLLKRDVEVLQRVQNQALRVLFGVSTSTCVAAMEALLGVESMETRRRVLRARFLRRMYSERDASFAVWHGVEELKTARRFRRQSCLWERPGELWREIEQRVRRRGDARYGFELAEWRKKEAARVQDKLAEQYSSCRPQGRWMLRELHMWNREAERRWTKWMLGRWPGKPVDCAQCGAREVRWRHFAEHVVPEAGEEGMRPAERVVSRVSAVLGWEATHEEWIAGWRARQSKWRSVDDLLVEMQEKWRYKNPE